MDPAGTDKKFVGDGTEAGPQRTFDGVQGYVRRCWSCGRTSHLSKDCRQPRRESSGKFGPMPAKSSPVAIELGAVQADTAGVEDHLQILQSDSYDSTEVRVVREADLRRPGWWW